MCPCNIHAQTQSFTVVICPWCPRRCTAQGRSLRTRQVLAVSLQYPGSKSQDSANILKHPIRVTDRCFHLLQMGNFHAFICLLLFWLMFGSHQLALMPSLMVLPHPYLFPGHHTCSVIAALQAEKEPSVLLPEITRLETSPSENWFPADLFFPPLWYKACSPPLTSPFPQSAP